MKRFALLLLFIVSFSCFADNALLNKTEPKIVVAVLNYDFGRFSKKQIKSVVVRVWNKGNAPLVLENVTASCGCTKLKWTKAPIMPGQLGYIRITFDGRYLDKGRFNKEVHITSNTPTRYHRFFINGELY